MAYGEYANSGRSYGKKLYQLSKIGVPIHIVESIIFEVNGTISYNGKLFISTVTWSDDDVPSFVFSKEYEFYNRLNRS